MRHTPLTAWQQLMNPLAVYIHWPFCKSKCPYCDFNSHVREQVDQELWRQSLLIELEWMATHCQNHEVTSIFFGGGTPSLMPPATAAALIERVCTLWPIAEDIEITLEANPTSVEAATFKDFYRAGVNRASLGVQSLDDAQLKFLGREHSAKEALTAVELAAGTFDRYSFDLIYARPGQSLKDWEGELQEALRYAGSHLSLYQLTIEQNTAFASAYEKGKLAMPDEETAEALYRQTEDMMTASGLPAYEVSNYAKPGEESRHNLAYWRGWDYIGIGPGAHGRIFDCPRRMLLHSPWDELPPSLFELRRTGKAGSACWPPDAEQEALSVNRTSFSVASNNKEAESVDSASLQRASSAYAKATADRCDLQEQITEAKNKIATATLKSPERWLAAVQDKGHGIELWEEMSEQEVLEERLMMGLRLTEGVPLAEVADILDENKMTLYIKQGLLTKRSNMLQATLKGRLVLNSLITELTNESGQ